MDAAGTRPAAEPKAAAAVDGPRIDRGLSRRQRVFETRIFREAFDRGAKLVGRFMVMWVRRGEGAALRVGVVASRRSFRRAVDRARAKRLLRESFRLNRHRFTGAVDVILVARMSLSAVRRPEAERDLLRLAEKAGLLRPAAGEGRECAGSSSPR